MTPTELLLLLLMGVWMLVAWSYRRLLRAAERQRDELLNMVQAAHRREDTYRAALERARTP